VAYAVAFAVVLTNGLIFALAAYDSLTIGVCSCLICFFENAPFLSLNLTYLSFVLYFFGVLFIASLLYEWQLALTPEEMQMVMRGTAESLYGKW